MKLQKFQKHEQVNTQSSNQNLNLSKETKTLAVVGPGYLFGDTDLVRERPYNTSLVSMEKNSEVYLLLKENFWQLFKGNDNARKVMIRTA